MENRKDIAVSIEILSYLRGVNTSAGYKARDAGKIEVNPETGLCPLLSDKNRNWIHLPPKRGRKKNDFPKEYPQTNGDLENEKLRADIDYKTKQSRKLDREHAERMGKLIHYDLANEWLGAYGSGVRIHLLDIPGRLASWLHAAVKSGAEIDTIRERLESEIGDGVERALDTGDRAVDVFTQIYEDQDITEDEEEEADE